MGSHGGPKIVRDSLKLLLDGRDEGLRGGKSTLTDGSGNSNSGTMYTGTGLAFDGSDDWVSMTQVTHPYNCTLMVWIKTSTADKSICSHSSGGPVNMNYSINASGFLEFDYYDGTWRNIDSNPVTVTDGNWHHIVFARNGTNHKMYKDGALIDEGTLNSQMSGAIDAIGRNWSGNYFNGSMSDFRIYSTQLSAADILEIYNGPNTILPGSITSSQSFQWLPLSEGTGTRAYDGSGNNRYGSFNSAPTYITIQPTIPQVAGKGLSRKAVFDESNDYVTNGSFTTWDLAGEWTVSFWMYMNSTGLQTMFSLQESGDANNKIEIITNNGAREIFVNNNGGVGTSSPTHHQADTANGVWSTNQWTHVVITNNGGTGALTGVYAIYVNGTSQSVVINSGTQTHPMDNSSRKLSIGKDTAGSRYVGGIMDEVAMWNTDLDADAVSAIYNSGKPLDVRDNYLLYDEYADNLRGYWRNQGAANWKDLSGYGHDLSSSGSPAVINSPEGKTSGRDSHGMNLSSPNAGFVSSTSHISVADSDDFWYGTDNFTIEMWAKRPTGAGSGAIYQQYVDDTNFQLIFYHSNDILYVYNRVGGTATPYLNTGSALPLDTWHHLVFVRYGTGANNMYVYVDTVSQSITWNTSLSANANIPNLAADLWFGKAEPYGYGTWGGQLSSMKVYKGKALSTAEISQNYNMHKSRFK